MVRRNRMRRRKKRKELITINFDDNKSIQSATKKREKLKQEGFKLHDSNREGITTFSYMYVK